MKKILLTVLAMFTYSLVHAGPIENELAVFIEKYSEQKNNQRKSATPYICAQIKLFKISMSLYEEQVAAEDLSFFYDLEKKDSTKLRDLSDKLYFQRRSIDHCISDLIKKASTIAGGVFHLPNPKSKDCVKNYKVRCGSEVY